MISMTYLQPHEDVVGTQRDEPFLSLDESAWPSRFALTTLADHLYRACLVGNPAPTVARMYERIANPQVGDFVFEVSAIMRKDHDRRIKGFGVLVAERREWWQTDEEWASTLAEEPDYGDRPVDHAWYIQYGQAAGDVCRWTNCRVIVVPLDPLLFDGQVPDET